MALSITFSSACILVFEDMLLKGFVTWKSEYDVFVCAEIDL